MYFLFLVLYFFVYSFHSVINEPFPHRLLYYSKTFNFFLVCFRSTCIFALIIDEILSGLPAYKKYNKLPSNTLKLCINTKMYNRFFLLINARDALFTQISLYVQIIYIIYSMCNIKTSSKKKKVRWHISKIYTKKKDKIHLYTNRILEDLESSPNEESLLPIRIRYVTVAVYSPPIAPMGIIQPAGFMSS